jgi:hypothetical protein
MYKHATPGIKKASIGVIRGKGGLLKRLRNGRFVSETETALLQFQKSEAKRPPGSRSGLKYPL